LQRWAMRAAASLPSMVMVRRDIHSSFGWGYPST
jgi:hypothetical protein